MKKITLFLFDARNGKILASILTVALLLWLLLFQSQQVPVVLYKLFLALLAGLAGYWLDTILFPYARPESYLDDDWHNHPDANNPHNADYPIAEGYEPVFAIALLRQALIIGFCMLGVSLGL